MLQNVELQVQNHTLWRTSSAGDRGHYLAICYCYPIYPDNQLNPSDPPRILKEERLLDLISIGASSTGFNLATILETRIDNHFPPGAGSPILSVAVSDSGGNAPTARDLLVGIKDSEKCFGHLINTGIEHNLNLYPTFANEYSKLLHEDTDSLHQICTWVRGTDE